MKLTYFQLEPHLAKNLASLYLITGDELLLMQDATQLIRTAAKNQGYLERTRITAESGFDWDELYNLLHSTSLFAEKRLIELDFRNQLPPKAASTILCEYAANPDKNNVLLIETGKVDDKISKSAWFNALAKTAAHLTLWPIPREQMPQWIIARAKKYKMTFQHDAAALLTDYVEGNLVAAAQVIEKAFLLKPEKNIDTTLLNLILVDESKFSVFDFVENMIAGNQKRALHILDNLKLEGIDPVLILWGITRELRLLADLSVEAKEKGMPYDSLFQKHRVFPKRQPALKRFLHSHGASDCLNLLKDAAEIDKMLKGASSYHAWDALQLFCLRI